jgi:hypothetical protein
VSFDCSNKPVYYSRAGTPGIEGADKTGLRFGGGKKLEGTELYCAQSKILGIMSKYLEESQASADYYIEFFKGYSKTERGALVLSVTTLRDSIKATMANIDKFLGGFQKFAKFNLEPPVSLDIIGKDCSQTPMRSIPNQGGYINRILDESFNPGSKNYFLKDSLFRNEVREIPQTSKNSKQIHMANVPVLNTNKQALLEYTSNVHKKFTGNISTGPRDLVVETKIPKASFTISPQKSPRKREKDAQRIIPRGDQTMKTEKTISEANLTPGLVLKNSDYTIYKKDKVLTKTFGSKGFFARPHNGPNPTKPQINSFNVGVSHDTPGLSSQVRKMTLDTPKFPPGGFTGHKSPKNNREKINNGIDIGVDLCLHVRPMQGMKESALTKSLVQLPHGKPKGFVDYLLKRKN